MAPMAPTATWQDKHRRWRIELHHMPDVRFAVYATNGFTESAPLWLFGMRALARWLTMQKLQLGDLEKS